MIVNNISIPCFGRVFRAQITEMKKNRKIIRSLSFRLVPQMSCMGCDRCFRSKSEMIEILSECKENDIGGEKNLKYLKQDDLVLLGKSEQRWMLLPLKKRNYLC